VIALIDYGIGNLRSVEKALQTIGAQVELTFDPDRILQAEKAVLPGVGAFGDGMSGMAARGLIEPVRELAQRGTPLLGICLGMQLLFDNSEELGLHEGLKILPGKVRRFPKGDLKVPQTGWNQLFFPANAPLTAGLKSGDYAYFNHSFYCDAEEPDDIAATTEYGVRYASVVARQDVYGVQFHPEKSQIFGLQILKNFVFNG